jgi:signal-transduction protein with cAMP-binding, CBS, and nucleotidyltransferase domain
LAKEIDVNQRSAANLIDRWRNPAEAGGRGRMQVTTVRQLLDQKGGKTWSISPDATVFDAIAKMAEKDIGSLVVMDGDELVGLITERHYARNVVLKGKTSPATPVRDIMEKRVFIARPEQSVEQCMALMTDKRVRHLPVVDGEELIGIISIGDLVKSIIGDQQFIIGQLEHYIRG